MARRRSRSGHSPRSHHQGARGRPGGCLPARARATSTTSRRSRSANSMGFDVATARQPRVRRGRGRARRLLHGGRRTGAGALEARCSGPARQHLISGLRRCALSLHVGERARVPTASCCCRPYEIVERAGRARGVHRRDHPVRAALPAPPLRGRRSASRDMSDAVNRWVPELRRRGVEAIVVLAHSGAPVAGRRRRRERPAKWWTRRGR